MFSTKYLPVASTPAVSDLTADEFVGVSILAGRPTCRPVRSITFPQVIGIPVELDPMGKEFAGATSV